MTVSGIRVRVTGIVFVFRSTSLVLKQVPTCIPKPEKNTFDTSVKFLHQLFFVVLDGIKSFQMVLGRLQIVLGCFRLFQVILDRFRLFQLIPHFSKYPEFDASDSVKFNRQDKCSNLRNVSLVSQIDFSLKFALDTAIGFHKVCWKM